MTKSNERKLNIHEAKTHLSRYIAKVEEGETILLCRNGRPVAQLAPLPSSRRQGHQRFGLGKGMGKIPDAFFAPLTEEELPDMGL